MVASFHPHCHLALSLQARIDRNTDRHQSSVRRHFDQTFLSRERSSPLRGRGRRKDDSPKQTASEPKRWALCRERRARCPKTLWFWFFIVRLLTPFLSSRLSPLRMRSAKTHKSGVGHEICWRADFALMSDGVRLKGKHTERKAEEAGIKTGQVTRSLNFRLACRLHPLHRGALTLICTFCMFAPGSTPTSSFPHLRLDPSLIPLTTQSLMGGKALQ